MDLVQRVLKCRPGSCLTCDTVVPADIERIYHTHVSVPRCRAAVTVIVTCVPGLKSLLVMTGCGSHGRRRTGPIHHGTPSPLTADDAHAPAAVRATYGVPVKGHAVAPATVIASQSYVHPVESSRCALKVTAAWILHGLGSAGTRRGGAPNGWPRDRFTCVQVP